jgi:dCMP deaminase
MNFAFDLAKRSTCHRLQVGAVVVSSDYTHVFGIGYNGNATGLPNRCDGDTPGQCGCLHAEENALSKTNNGKEINKYLFTTHRPCSYCAKRIINKGGIEKVFYSLKYRSEVGVNLLKDSGIEVFCLEKGLCH